MIIHLGRGKYLWKEIYIYTLSCPPTSHTVKLTFLYSTVSTLKPIVGIVVTISPSFNLYSIVVFPAASRPTIRILISFLEKNIFTNRDIVKPIPETENCRWSSCRGDFFLIFFLSFIKIESNKDGRKNNMIRISNRCCC